MLLRNKILWLCLFLIPVAWQLWIPPYTGLADNGDFVKVVGRASLAAIDPGPQSTFHFFNRLWRNEPNALWVSPYWGIEVWLAKLAMWIGNTNPFDIRWLGLVHVIIFAAAIWLLIQRRIAPTLFACKRGVVRYEPLRARQREYQPLLRSEAEEYGPQRFRVVQIAEDDKKGMVREGGGQFLQARAQAGRFIQPMSPQLMQPLSHTRAGKTGLHPEGFFSGGKHSDRT